MKRFHTFMMAALTLPMTMAAQGWPADYGGVMLQGFYWDGFKDAKWTRLERQAADFSGYFDLVWVPQSGKTQGGLSMGYDPYYYFNQNSSFGSESELRSMMKTFKDKGIGTIADVVVNHRSTSGWFTFPAETYQGVTYQMTPQDITANDDGGATARQATLEGVTLSSNIDEGEDFGGFRDLDHKSTNVQTIVKAYAKYLIDDLGYTGFRYDVAKGFAPSHLADYNNYAGPKFAVGEVWDGDAKIKSVINGSGKTTAAFDFQFRYTVRNAVGSGDWSRLGQQNDDNWPLVSSSNDNGAYRQYAVTFVENHDTEQRSATNQQDPIRRDTLAANAYMLAMPGTPCVFYKHYLAYPNEIKAMIDVRKAAGIANTSSYNNYRSSKAYYANTVNGSRGTLLVCVGSGFTDPAASRYVKVLSGRHYALYLSPSTEVAFADKPSGTYAEAFSTRLTAVSANGGARLVYTTDGSDPSASNGTTVDSGTSVAIGQDCTLKVGLLVGGQVTHTVTRQYTIKAGEVEDPVVYETPPAGYTYHAYFIAPASWGSEADVYAWAWVENGANYTPDNNASWPGDNEHVYRIAKAGDGGYVWQWCYYGTETTPPAMIIFNNGSSGVGTNQTKDMTFTDGGWYNIGTTEANPTLGIQHGMTVGTGDDGAWHTLSGMRLGGRPTQKGVYVHGGKKVVK